MTTQQEMRFIQDALDKWRVPKETFCSGGAVASRVEWVLKRNAVLEKRCEEWAQKCHLIAACGVPAALGKLGGKAKSPAKTKSARENGAKGGRPKTKATGSQP